MERRSDLSDGTTRTTGSIDARTSLALWLRAGRAHRGMSLDDVAKVTKIQPRILERLEAGKLDGLPADVFVRGFVRSFARCVGLEEAEALRRYAACGLASVAPVAAASSVVLDGLVSSGVPEVPTGQVAAGTADLTPTARALVEAMAELMPATATATATGAGGWTGRKLGGVEIIDLAAGSLQDLRSAAVLAAAAKVEAVAAAAEKIEADAAATAKVEAALAAVAKSEAEAAAAAAGEVAAAEVVAEPAAPEAVAEEVLVPVAMVAAAEAPIAAAAVAVEPPAPMARESSKKKRRRDKRNKRASNQPTSRELLAIGTPVEASPVVASKSGATWAPKMPPAAASVPWRKPAYAAAVAMVPSLVIDDADPDSAERVLEERAEKHSLRRSFLPPILLDREDRSARQGGLTLAVIILLIAATLTLSYLMRRPSASGDGMTQRSVPASKLG
jgi:hypothetical protein